MTFCFHDATLQPYLARSVYAMDMVDSALKTLGLALVKYNKYFKKHDRKKILDTVKKGPVFDFFEI